LLLELFWMQFGVVLLSVNAVLFLPLHLQIPDLAQPSGGLLLDMPNSVFQLLDIVGFVKIILGVTN
jgi:hypothetical protein